MDHSVAVDGFRLAYERTGSGPAAVLLHGWPGDHTEYRAVAALLPTVDVVIPDLRGFGASDRHSDERDADPTLRYGPDAQARSIIGLIAGSPRPSSANAPTWSGRWFSRRRCPASAIGS